MLHVVSYDEAIRLIKDNLKYLNFNKELISISTSFNRILSKDIISKENLPSYERSTMDGYAIVASDSYGSSHAIPAVLKIVGEVKMGEDTKIKLEKGQAAYIPTGGKIPEGANAVVMVEHTERLHDEAYIYQAVRVKENITLIAEDMAKGAIAIKKGSILNPMHIGLLASLGITEVEVYKGLKIYVISTGDEIVEANTDVLPHGKIRDANRYILESFILKNNILVGYSLCKDNLEDLTKTIEKALKLADIVIISGGSSVGERDYSHKAVESNGANLFIDGIAIKPGKPTFIARKDNKLIYCLAGHPMAVGVGYKLFVENVINSHLGIPNNLLLKAKAGINFPSFSGRTTVMPVSLEYKDELIAMPLFSKSSLTSILAKASGYAIIHANIEGIYKDNYLDIHPLT